MSTSFSRPRVRSLLTLIGTGRDSSLSALRVISPLPVGSLVHRISSLALGSTLIGVAVAMLVQADLGLAPFDVFASGLSDLGGLTLGQAGWSISAVLFLTATILGRRPSLWGLAYVFANGIAIDSASGLLNQPDSLLGRTAFALGGVVVMASAVNIVLHSGTTGGPFELLMKAGEDRGANRTHIRYGLDVGVLFLGLALGGAFGVATIAYAALMGPTLQVINTALNDHAAGRARRQERQSGVRQAEMAPDGCEMVGAS